MDQKEQLQLQAFLDGELPENEARAVAADLARDPDRTLLLGELRNTRQALAGFENSVRLPESREFFWSKVRREIEREERLAAQPAQEKRTFVSRWGKFLLPAAAAGALAMAFLLITRPGGVVRTEGGPELEAAFADPGAFTYRDFSRGTTLVWFSYPAENEVADKAGEAKLP